MTGQDLNRHLFQEVADILAQQQGFRLDGYKGLYMRRRIASRIRMSGCATAEDYVAALADDHQEQERLLAALSIHVSHFFRNPSVFGAIEKRVLPELLKRREKDPSPLRIWSAGCANGEEIYSLAILCDKAGLADEQSVSLVGTDLSAEALDRARTGLYPEERLEQVSALQRQEYFLRSDSRFQLRDEIRERVQFVRHDILMDAPFLQADLILCRNLLIYFSREQQQQVLIDLTRALLPGGYLVLGRAETLPAVCREELSCIDVAERIYQRNAR